MNTEERIDKNNQLTAQEMLLEINECREDERNTENQTVQVIATAGTVLGVIYGASVLGKSEDFQLICLLLNNFVFCTAFSYITALGMKNILRFHYLRSLEDQLSELHSEDSEGIMHWMSLSSVVTTRNPKHLTTTFSKSHYLFYTLAIITAILFGGTLTVSLYMNLDVSDSSYVRWVTLLPVILMVISLGVYFITCVRAEQVYKYAYALSKERKRKRIAEGKKESRSEKTGTQTGRKNERWRRCLKVFGYFLYPRTQDPQKPVLIILGFLSGIFFANGCISVGLIDSRKWQLLWVMLVIDFLVYQARFQLNDIRGIKEDIQAGKDSRLPVQILGMRRAVKVSLAVLALKFTGALLITVWIGGHLQHILWLSIAAILISTVFYEKVRARKYDLAVFFAVGLGYPIRLLTGMWAAWPDMWKQGILSGGNRISSFIFVGVLLAYLFLGSFSSILSWTQETVRARHGLHKSHYERLFKSVRERYNMAEEKNLTLREKGDIKDDWNIYFMLSMISLSAVLLAAETSVGILAAEVFVLGSSVLLCRARHKGIILYTLVSAILVAAKAVFLAGSLPWYPLYLYICITQAFFIILYFFLRYFFDPDFQIGTVCRSLWNLFIFALIGRETAELLYREKEEKLKSEAKRPADN